MCKGVLASEVHKVVYNRDVASIGLSGLEPPPPPPLWSSHGGLSVHVRVGPLSMERKVPIINIRFSPACAVA